MRIVGEKDRDEFVLDPVEALRRGAKLDEQMKMLVAPIRAASGAGRMRFQSHG